MMNTLFKKLLTFQFALIPFLSFAEEFIVFGPSVPSGSTTSISWMEQTSFGITVVTKEENEMEIPRSDRQIFGTPSNVVDVQAPSIAIADILSELKDALVDRNLGVIMFDVVGRSEILGMGEVVAFDFNKNDGWVISIGFGDLNIKYYPWVWHPVLGWIYCHPAGVEDKRLSYWFWSEKLGWIWTQREIFPLIWMANEEDWRLIRTQLAI